MASTKINTLETTFHSLLYLNCRLITDKVQLTVDIRLPLWEMLLTVPNKKFSWDMSAQPLLTRLAAVKGWGEIFFIDYLTTS